MCRLRLVLIEDHQALREGLELLLGREGCDVVGAAGHRGRGPPLVEELAPDVALVDIRLGEDDGIALTRRLLDATPSGGSCSTRAPDEELLFDGLDSGARGYALKDGTPRELVEALGAGRRRRHLRRSAAAPGAALAPGDRAAAVALEARARDPRPARAGADRRGRSPSSSCSQPRP